MNFARFFVTVVFLFGTVISMGCSDKKTGKSDPARMSSLKKEVKSKWDDSDVQGRELAQAFRILILDAPIRAVSTMTLIDSRLMGQKFNWGRLTFSERQTAKEKLAKYVTNISRLIEIDAKRGVYITNMDKVRSRYQGALAFQESLTFYEKAKGEQYEPANPGQPPTYNPPVDVDSLN
jgi:hypothetical protein